MAITFERNLSPELTAFFAAHVAANSRAYNSVLAAHFVLKDDTNLYYATAGITVDSVSREGVSNAITPLVFAARLSGAPDVRFAAGRTPDTGQLEVINLDYIITTALTDVDRIFEAARVRLYLCFPKSDGAYEGLVLFDGYLTDLSGDDETAQMTVQADVSSPAATLGAEITQRCLNELGDSWCGVTHLPGAAACSKVWSDHENGCAYWGGVYRGVPFINPNGLVQGYSGTVIGGGGFDNSCPDAATTWFATPDGYVHARDLRPGAVLQDHAGRLVQVEGIEHVHAPYRYLVETARARLIVSATHRFLRNADDTTGKSALAWDLEADTLLTRTPEGIVLERPVAHEGRDVHYAFRPALPGMVLKLSVTAPHTYLAGMERGYMLGNHNNKWNRYDLPIIL